MGMNNEYNILPYARDQHKGSPLEMVTACTFDEWQRLLAPIFSFKKDMDKRRSTPMS